MKKANLYIFDEPTSYLDIKQRIVVSNFIQKLADSETAVLVVEHDLIILDYMTDMIHLMYGKPGVYGVVSLPYTTKNGINVYLEGYLPDSNIRFRDHAIKFDKAAFIAKKELPIDLVSWSGIKKKLDKFSLLASEGSLYKHEVVGILGENGIGKTSFVKILAGVLDTDAGTVNGDIKVAYKPQYLEGSSELVMVVLKNAINKYDTALIKPLNIRPLFTKQLDQLSGGELQRVAICLCLSTEADLILMDEPSAYLDVEQRLIVAKVIRNLMENSGKTAFIVDHDLMFLDFLSNRLAVFDGVPAETGNVTGVFPMKEGMNGFLAKLDITFRRDAESGRPRANKPGSVKDREQKGQGKYYY